MQAWIWEILIIGSTLYRFSVLGGGRGFLPNMLILSGNNTQKNDLEGNVSFVVSGSGYSNNEIEVQWLEHFEECTILGKTAKGHGGCSLWVELVFIQMKNL